VTCVSEAARGIAYNRPDQSLPHTVHKQQEEEEEEEESLHVVEFATARHL